MFDYSWSAVYNTWATENRWWSLVLQKNDIYLLLFFAIPAQENRTDDAESRLVNHLMKNYDMKRQILPTNNRSKAVVVTFDMAFSLLVDLVSRVGLLTQSRYN